MPLELGVSQLNRTNCVGVMLRAFQSNTVVKALIFMPGATDEFNMFRRAVANLDTPQPTLLEAVHALTNQTRIRASFVPPLLLLHTEEDSLAPLIRVEHSPTADKLRLATRVSHLRCDDQDWDSLQPVLKKTLKIQLRPWRYSAASWHFYRHSFAAWNLSGWEALQAMALAGKTGFIVRRGEVIFVPDRRIAAHQGTGP